MGEALTNLRRLGEHVGTGKIKANVVINQPYAQDQHETMHYKHPRGGRAKYLEGPLFENHRDYYQDIADAILDPEGPSPQDKMIGVGRRIVRDSSLNTPVEFGDLRRSGALRVLEGTRLVHREPPEQPRLSEAELDAKDYLRHMGVGYRA